MSSGTINSHRMWDNSLLSRTVLGIARYPVSLSNQLRSSSSLPTITGTSKITLVNFQTNSWRYFHPKRSWSVSPVVFDKLLLTSLSCIFPFPIPSSCLCHSLTPPLPLPSSTDLFPLHVIFNQVSEFCFYTWYPKSHFQLPLCHWDTESLQLCVSKISYLPTKPVIPSVVPIYMNDIIHLI